MNKSLLVFALFSYVSLTAKITPSYDENREVISSEEYIQNVPGIKYSRNIRLVRNSVLAALTVTSLCAASYENQELFSACCIAFIATLCTSKLVSYLTSKQLETILCSPSLTEEEFLVIGYNAKLSDRKLIEFAKKAGKIDLAIKITATLQ